MSDGNPPSPKRRSTSRRAIEFIVEAQVAMGRHRGLDEGRIRRDIARAFQEALDDDGEAREAEDLARGGPIGMINLAGMFRLVFDEWGLDRSDQFMQESWYAIASRAVERAIALTRP
ncbi:hypothetical protein [Singulisphaera sp. PoT]|uniref:hypothetical protein n=1 Tax=Singulisphaera sp. PoT TaxID=3411797 RepID=UPI003BF49B39